MNVVIQLAMTDQNAELHYSRVVYYFFFYCFSSDLRMALLIGINDFLAYFTVPLMLAQRNPYQVMH